MSPAAVLLLASLVINAGALWGWHASRGELATAIAQRDSARADATACSDATEALRTLADQRKRSAAAARAAARRAAAAHDQRADAILAKPASVPGDDCRSAAERAQAWLASRAAP